MNKLDRLVRHSIDLDFPERMIDDKREHSQEDKKFIQKVNETIELVDGHYKMGLPFKTERVRLPDNQQYALQRFKGLERKLRNNPKFHTDYQKFMADILEKGYAGSCRITKWVSNSREVLEAIPKEERAKEIKDLKLEYDCLPVERALGTSWSVESDTIGFQINIENRPATRRGILSIISSVYDPIGLAAPFILPARILLQDLCRRGIGWDAKIREDDRKKWQRWLSDLPKLENVSAQRCYKPADFGEVKVCEIHHFSDASEYGYGVASYIRFVNEDGRIHCAFLMGKARVAPLKKITIPRQELTAAAVAVGMNRMLEKEPDINNEKWKYINTKSNPADDASRGLTVDKFLQNKRWLQGPDFLWKPESEWPTQEGISGALSNKDPEVKREVSVYSTVLVEQAFAVEKILLRYSNLTKLKKIVGWFLLAKKNFLDRCRKENKTMKATTKTLRRRVVKKQSHLLH
ncbi:uncharacterized protein [Ptychodera flava]|uniref:uncharacterized protein n=1 Tax=Ptychodera flava TaxID=63121 RepID=UPI00396A907C